MPEVDQSRAAAHQLLERCHLEVKPTRLDPQASPEATVRPFEANSGWKNLRQKNLCTQKI
jgi:hypothetical protein